ncbi:MAG: Dam family site-specific DNA-(adenine-N6)-methyltransferase, partial [Bacteroidales bacterium]|nr:Dam family site-specific DNA-(adenine-N6)-methyltransferase [Bacteroidales bacterium]
MDKAYEASTTTTKPFLKWAGGKSQLLGPILKAADTALQDKNEFIYIEPFIGSGAVFLEMMNRYGNKITKAVINDRNEDLIQAYRVVRDQVADLLKELERLKISYYDLQSEASRKNLYYNIRADFNERKYEAVKQTAMLIFLNKTCYNGLYRVNSKNHFNVPFGKYKTPGIFEKDKLETWSNLLQDVTIVNKDFTQLLSFIDETMNSFVYLDPPYRPISSTASFNAYAKDAFDDNEQIRLKAFCDTLHKKGSYWLLSNSEPKNTDR